MGAHLSRLILSNIRNLAETDLALVPKLNVFVGANGSGKTSLLEAIHVLGVGRSFRARSMQQVISFGAQDCLVRAKVNPNADQPHSGVWLGVARDLAGGVQYRVGEKVEKSSAELTKKLPLQLIDVNSPLLLEGGPNYRRQFVDWGVFHVEHDFLNNWRLMQRALEQRNAALKKRQQPPAVWDELYIKYSLAVDAARLRYIAKFSEIFTAMLRELLDITNIELRYFRGWSEDKDLFAVLSSTLSLDLALGYTNRGPHRAELEVLIGGRAVKSVLSRGQLKIFVCVMLLARTKLLETAQRGVFLIDDLHAELDKRSCSIFVSAIKALGCQAFITGVEADVLNALLQGCAAQMFHVEQGRIEEYTG